MNKSAGATAVTIVKDLMNSQNNLEQDSPLEANEDSPPA
jgi:hypothetical protein